MSKTPIYQIALNLGINQLFSYQADFQENLEVNQNLLGHLVLVSFGKSQKNSSTKNEKIGLVVRQINDTEKKQIKEKKIQLKTIDKVLTQSPVLNEIEINWLIELSKYFHQPIGEMIFQALPKGYKTYPTFKKLVQQKQQRILGFLNYWKVNSIDTQEHKKNESIQKLSKAQREFFNQLLLNFKNQPFNGTELKKIKAYSKPRFEKLAQLDLVQKHQFDFSKPVDCLKIKLTKEQKEIKDKIAKKIDSFAINLIYGDTATGKTEIYIQLINHILKQKKQVLYLVPEIGLINQVVKRLEKSTSLPILSIHSNRSLNEHHQIFNAIQSGQFAILVGTRLSAFFSFKRLGLIVIDEEHDSSYKQIENLHYSAKEVLFLKAKKLNIPVVLGSATPSLEIMKLAIEKKLQTHRLIKTNQINQRKVHLIDMKAEPKDRIFSLPLLQMIEENLKKEKQCLLFLNRRGYAPILKCNNCNWSMYCSDCDSAMVFHQFDQLMHCHHCNQKKLAKNQCPICSFKPLKMIGSGTEKLEELLTKQFKNTPIWRIDRDKTERKGALTALIDSIQSQKSGIIIGTQMLSKGHDFLNVSLVAVIDVDWYLLKADLNSQQKLSQLLIQVMGRAGRKEINCDVILQTRNPESELIQNLIDKGYDGFLDKAINQAKKYKLPPFGHQAACMASSTNRQKLYQFLSCWRNELLSFHFDNKIEFWQIEPSPIEKKSNRYFAYFLIYAQSRNAIHQALHLSEKKIIPTIKLKNQVRHYFDVNCTAVDF